MKTINQLTSLRFFAALWVVAYHTLKVPDGWIASIIGFGYLGVPLFFVLSGFVLTYNYSERLDKVSQVPFLQARFARIFPMLLVATVFSACLAPFFSHMKHTTILVEVVVTLTFLLAWFPLAGLNSPAWSLSTEAFFYAFFRPLASRFKKASDGGLWLSLIGFGVLALILPFALIAFLKPSVLEHSAIGRMIATNPIVRLPTFCCGIFAGLIYLRKTEKAVQWMSSELSLVISLILTACACAYATTLHMGSNEFRNYFLQAATSGLVTIPMCLFLLYMASSSRLLTKLLQHKWLILLGEASYAMYLLHFPMWSVADRLIETHPSVNAYLIWSVYFLIVVGASMASFVYIETPARLLLRPKRVALTPIVLPDEVVGS
jgi:peptidoglycan/LPS O-acetylase OafA/YrhL